MITRKSLMFLLCTIFLAQLVVAQPYKMEIATIPEDKVFFQPGKTMGLIVSLKDSNNNLVNDEVSIIIEDLRGEIIQEETIMSNIVEEIKLSEDALAGDGKIIARYKDSEITESFSISEKQLARFEIDGDTLIVTNIGNTKYGRKISIIIGDTKGTKTPNLDIGESVSYRLVAPEGVYNVKVSDDGSSTPLEIGDVRLTGTGRVIGALDESAGASGITGISPEEESEGELLSLKRSKFIYAFVLVIFGAMILLVIERRFRKKV